MLLRTGALHPLPNLSGCKCTRCTRTNEAPVHVVLVYSVENTFALLAHCKNTSKQEVNFMTISVLNVKKYLHLMKTTKGMCGMNTMVYGSSNVVIVNCHLMIKLHLKVI